MVTYVARLYTSEYMYIYFFFDVPEHWLLVLVTAVINLRFNLIKIYAFSL